MVFCVPTADGRLNVTVSVTDALTSVVGGCIRCTPVMATPPVTFAWQQGTHAALLELNDGRNEAHDVPPGQYTIHVRDAKGREATVHARVELTALPTVVAYDVQNASSDTARDGSVVARVVNCDGCRFLWTTGVVTHAPQLLDARPGVYTVAPIPTGTRTLPFVHSCAAAIVEPSRRPLGEEPDGKTSAFRERV